MYYMINTYFTRCSHIWEDLQVFLLFFFFEWVGAEIVIYLSLEIDADVEKCEQMTSLFHHSTFFQHQVIIWGCFTFCNSYPSVPGLQFCFSPVSVRTDGAQI